MNIIRRHRLIENEHTPYVICGFYTKEVIVASNIKDKNDGLIVLCSTITLPFIYQKKITRVIIFAG
jgi:hypothetical protein